jgi:hypothetical protein
LLTYALPDIAVQARIELARVRLTLADLGGARTLMREIEEVLMHRPGLGTLTGEADALRTQLSKRRGPDALGASSLTAAELRLLPLLSTHLSFAEIGAELFLSPNTAKRTRSRSTASWAPPTAARLSARPGNWAGWKADGRFTQRTRSPAEIPSEGGRQRRAARAG